jgi:cytochrome c biogenesis protein CcdA
MDTAVNQWLEAISASISANMWLAPLLALAAGILTSVTPCALTSVPLLSVMLEVRDSVMPKGLWAVSCFCCRHGFYIHHIGYGSLSSWKAVAGAGSWWYILLGILMLLMLCRLGRYIILFLQHML